MTGSVDAASDPEGVRATDELHAVQAGDYTSLCGVPVVFVFVDIEFPGSDPAAAICPRCLELAAGFTAAG